MKIFFMEWNSFGNDDMIENLEAMGHEIRHISFADDTIKQEQIEALLGRELKKSACDFIFSFNYYPEISKACKQLELKYVSWIYDSPHMAVYSYTVVNDCNYVFLFDYAMYRELSEAGIRTVYYLPLAINLPRMLRLDQKYPVGEGYQSEITFIGSLYTEKKHCLYEKFSTVPDYVKGYLDGLIQAQKNVQGYLFMQELLTEEIVKEMQKAYPTNPESECVLSPEAIYADYVLARQVTALERKECLERLGRVARTKLYTHEKTVQIGNVINCGPCDYYNQMPQIIRTSKINLNITLRSIKTGIPLRVLDIMGNGGFLVTNYQEEMMQYFEPDKEFVYYGDIEELSDKAEYYLAHDEERRRIAERGCERVRNGFTYQLQLKKLLDIVGGER